MFVLENFRPRFFRYSAKFLITQNVFNNQGQQMFDNEGNAVTASLEQEVKFFTKEECDKAVLEHPEIQFEIQEIPVDDFVWVEDYEFSSPEDVLNALEAGKDGKEVNMYLYVKDGILKAMSVLLLRQHDASMVYSKAFEQAVECIQKYIY